MFITIKGWEAFGSIEVGIEVEVEFVIEVETQVVPNRFGYENGTFY